MQELHRRCLVWGLHSTSKGHLWHLRNDDAQKYFATTKAEQKNRHERVKKHKAFNKTLFSAEITTKVLTVFLLTRHNRKKKREVLSHTKGCEVWQQSGRFSVGKSLPWNLSPTEGIIVLLVKTHVCACRGDLNSHTVNAVAVADSFVAQFDYSYSHVAHKKSLMQRHVVHTRAQWFRTCTKRDQHQSILHSQAWLETHTAALHRGEWVGAVAYRCSCPKAVVEATVKSQPRRTDSWGTAAQKQNGTWGHTQSLVAHSTSNWGPCQQPVS